MSSQIHALAILLSTEKLLFIHLREGQVGPPGRSRWNGRKEISISNKSSAWQKYQVVQLNWRFVDCRCLHHQVSFMTQSRNLIHYIHAQISLRYSSSQTDTEGSHCFCSELNSVCPFRSQSVQPNNWSTWNHTSSSYVSYSCSFHGPVPCTLSFRIHRHTLTPVGRLASPFICDSCLGDFETRSDKREKCLYLLRYNR
jgi:hypothetical protein